MSALTRSCIAQQLCRSLLKSAQCRFHYDLDLHSLNTGQKDQSKDIGGFSSHALFALNRALNSAPSTRITEAPVAAIL